LRTSRRIAGGLFVGAVIACHSTTGPTVARVTVSPMDTTISLTGTVRIQFHVYDSAGRELFPDEFGLSLGYGSDPISIDSLSHAQLKGHEPLQLTVRAKAAGSSDIILGATMHGVSMTTIARVHVVGLGIAVDVRASPLPSFTARRSRRSEREMHSTA
jgi:hypothetical protein